jgi:hypothetical protein
MLVGSLFAFSSSRIGGRGRASRTLAVVGWLPHDQRLWKSGETVAKIIEIIADKPRGITRRGSRDPVEIQVT